MRLPFNNIIIKRGRLRWLLRQEQIFHHYLMNKTFDNLPEDYDQLVMPKNSKPFHCSCKGCKG